MNRLTIDDALQAARELGLRPEGDERNPAMWHATCPVCVMSTTKKVLAISCSEPLAGERIGQQPAILHCRNGCPREEILARLTGAVASSMRETGRIVAESFAAIETERTAWLWDGRIPLCAPTLLVGREKLGKSTLTCELAARVSRGTLPGDLYGTPASVLLLSYEDSAGSTIKPRLLAAGADPALVFQASAHRDGMHDLVSLPDDVDAIGDVVREHGCRLVIVDPFSASLGAEINSHRDHDMRRAIASLAQLADSENTALLLVAHFNKSPAGDSLTRVLGSRALTAASRSVLVFGRAPDSEDRSPDRVLAHAACNLAAEAPSIACTIEPSSIPTEAGLMETSRLVLLGETDAQADDLLATRTDDERTDRDAAGDWLLDELACGEWQAAAEIKERAKAEGIAVRTLQRALKQHAIETRREGFPARTEWRLPVAPPTHGATGATDSGATTQTRTPEPNSMGTGVQLRHFSQSGATAAESAVEERSLTDALHQRIGGRV